MKIEKSNSISDDFRDIDILLNKLQDYPDHYVAKEFPSELSKILINIKKQIKGLYVLLILSFIGFIGMLATIIYQDIYSTRATETSKIIQQYSKDSLADKILESKEVNDSTRTYLYGQDSTGKLITYPRALKISDSLLTELIALKKAYSDINNTVSESYKILKNKTYNKKSKDSIK